MSSSPNKIIQYLNDDYDSSGSVFDDSDADPDFNPDGSQSMQLSQVSSLDLFSPGPSTIFTTQPPINLSDDENSIEVTSSSSEGSDSDFSDSDGWVDNHKDIYHFQFVPDHSGVQINVQESAQQSPIELFRQIWTNEILDIIVDSTNNYGQNITLQNRPHNKSSRKSTFKATDKKEIEKFLGLCLLFGSAKFSVLRYAFSNNPLYYHPNSRHTLSGRRF